MIYPLEVFQSLQYIFKPSKKKKDWTLKEKIQNFWKFISCEHTHETWKYINENIMGKKNTRKNTETKEKESWNLHDLTIIKTHEKSIYLICNHQKGKTGLRTRTPRLPEKEESISQKESTSSSLSFEYRDKLLSEMK